MEKKYSIKDRKRFEVLNLLTSGVMAEKEAGEDPFSSIPSNHKKHFRTSRAVGKSL